ncbi:GTPase-activating protein [Chytriomyces hyalinus]|nr:GTPase-activating protein [Chytriomyces hyalinus]
MQQQPLGGPLGDTLHASEQRQHTPTPNNNTLNKFQLRARQRQAQVLALQTPLLSLLNDSERVAFIPADDRRPLTHSGLRQFAFNFDCASLDISKTDRVGILLPEGPEMAVAIVTLASLCCVVPINDQLTDKEVLDEIQLAPVTSILVSADRESDHLIGQLANIGIQVYFLTPSESICGLFSLRTNSVPPQRTSSIERQYDPLGPNDTALLLKTSGTSGTKKVVPYSLATLVIGALCVADSWGLQQDDIGVNMMPLFHIGGIARNILAPVVSGSGSILARGFDPTRFWLLVNKYQPTWYFAVPTMHSAVLDEFTNGAWKGKGEQYFRMVGNSGSGLPDGLARQLNTVFSAATILPSYGMTECLPIASPPLDYKLEKPGTSGLPVGPEVLIVDAQGNALPPHTFGRILIKGAPLFNGYAHEEPGSSFNKQGFFDTGDMGHLDNDGFIFVTGRSKEVINRGGEIISPVEIEDALTQHPSVNAAIAFSVPHAKLQETVGIVLSLDKGSPYLPMQEIHDFISDKLHPSKWPQVVVYLEGGIPKNVRNKPLRLKLAERFDLPTIGDTSSTQVPREYAGVCPPIGTPLTEPISIEALTLSQSVPNSVTRKELSMQELLVARAWSSTLNIPLASISPASSFFSLGGDSLSAIKVASRMASLGMSVSVSELFRLQTVSKIAAFAASKLGHQHLASTTNSKKVVDAEILEEIETDWMNRLDLEKGQYKVAPVLANQVGLLLAAKFDPTILNTSYVFKAHHHVSLEYLERVWRFLASERDILRTTFIESKRGEFYLAIRETAQKHVVQEVSMDIHDFLKADKLAGFPIGSKHWARLTLVRGNVQQGDYIVLSLHHVIFDGWCLPMYCNDFLSAYCNGPTVGSIIQRPQFSTVLDYVSLKNEAATVQFWRNYLFSSTGCKDLQMGPKLLSDNEDANIRIPSKSAYDQIQQVSKKCGVTSAAVLKAAFVILLRELMKTNDVIFGELLTGRDIDVKDADMICGSLINGVPCRVQIGETTSAMNLITQLHDEHGLKLPFTHAGLNDMQKIIGGNSPAQLVNCLFLFQMLPQDSTDKSAFDLKLTRYRPESTPDTRSYFPFEIVPDLVDGSLFITAKFNRDNTCRSQAFAGAERFNDILNTLVVSIMASEDLVLLKAFPVDVQEDMIQSDADTRARSILRDQKNLRAFVDGLKQTVFFNESPAVSAFRDHINSSSNNLTDAALLESFSKMVHVTQYSDYEPYISRFFHKPCLESKVVNLLTPGLPTFIAHSSSTSGGKAKSFPTCADDRFQSNGKVWTQTAARYLKHENGKYCSLHSLVIREAVSLNMDVTKDPETVSIPVCLGSVGYHRDAIGHLDMAKEKDLVSKMDADTGYPLALKLIRNYKTFLLMNACFMIADDNVEHITMVFSTMLLDFIRCISTNWNDLVDAVHTGVLPLSGVDPEIAAVLQNSFIANPQKAATLKGLKPHHGWLKQVWPNLEILEASSGGVFADALPEIMWNTGDTVTFKNGVFASTETNVIGLSLSSDSDPNLFQIVDLYSNVFEYLPVDVDDAKPVFGCDLTQGQKYELLVTNPQVGLWRYNLGDVLESVSFDSVSCQPIVRFSGRNMAIRLSTLSLIHEYEIKSAISEVFKKLGTTTEFCVYYDDSDEQRKIRYLIEEADGTAAFRSQSQILLDLLNETLCRINKSFEEELSKGNVHLCAISVLKRGTFSEFRNWRVESSGSAAGQIKVPVILKNEAHKIWLLSHVSFDLSPQKEQALAHTPGTNKPQEFKINYLNLYSEASVSDTLLLLFGLLVSAITGALLPLTTLVFGHLINVFSSPKETASLQGDAYASALDSWRSNVISECNKFSLMFVYLAIATLIGTCEVITYRLRVKYLQSVLNKNVNWHDNSSSGEVSTRHSRDIQLIQDAISEKVPITCAKIFTLISAFCVAFYRSWRLALVLSSVVPVLCASGFLMRRLSSKSQQITLNSYTSASQIASEAFPAMKTIIAFSAQSKIFDKFSSEVQKAQKSAVRTVFVTGAGLGAISSVTYLVYSLAFYYGQKLLSYGEIDVGSIINVIFAIVIGSSQIQQVAFDLEAFSLGLEAGRQVFAAINCADEESETLLNVDVEGLIEFKNVKFSYPARPDVPVLKGVTLSIKPGMSVGICGKSGSGKSTIIQLLEKFYNPSSGEILIDGRDIQTLNSKSLRSQIGYISQEPVLFSGSVLDNVLRGLPVSQVNALTDEEKLQVVRHACKISNADKFISELPESYHTELSERGTLLSGGQKQRIAIARAIVGNPKIIVLDEATSALDTISEGVVQKALESAAKGRTSITIAHRLSTIRNSDMIVCMDAGEISESGSHDELMKLKGMYASLIEATSLDISQSVAPIKYDTSAVLEKEAGLEEAFQGAADEESGVSVKLRLGAILFEIFVLSKPDMLLNIGGLIAAVSLGAVAPLFGTVLAHAIGSFSKDSDDVITRWSLAFLLIAIAATVVTFAQAALFGVANVYLTTRIREKFFKTILFQEMPFFQSAAHSTGVLTSNLAVDVHQVQGAGGVVLGNLIQLFVTSFGGIIVGFYYNWKLAAVATSILPVLILAGGFRMSIMVNFQAKSRKAHEKASQITSEHVAAIRTVKSLGNETLVMNQYCSALNTSKLDMQKNAFGSSAFYAIAQSVHFLSDAIMFAYGGRLVAYEGCTLTSFFAVYATVILASFSAGKIFSVIPDFARARQSAEKIVDILKLTVDSKDDGKPVSATLKSSPPTIELTNVKFAYPSHPDSLALRGVSFTVNPGQFVALVGPSGSGKSTIINLLERFYQPTSGSISINSTDVKGFNLKSYREMYGLVSQETNLFDMTFMENIGFGLPQGATSTETVMNAAKVANIHDFIVSLPEGYNTKIGQGGVALSGGQRQRLAIARAAVRGCPILLMDEATAALDNESEKSVQAALIASSSNKTIVAVAHRLSTITQADMIHVLDKGKIVESGNHEQLLQMRGLYFQMAEKQSLV